MVENEININQRQSPQSEPNRRGYDQKLPELYTRFGSYGNNTTIPEAERERIALAAPEQNNDRGRRIRAGEHALHSFYEEFGLAPSGTWMEFMGFGQPAKHVEPHLSELPLSVQKRRRKNGGLSKSRRNIELFNAKREKGTIFQE